MKKTLFISDLHLSPSVPHLVQRFVQFMEQEAHEYEALYVLGDLFEVWLGDDTPLEHYAPVAKAFQHLAQLNIPVYFMHGNRDFLIGYGFADACGIRLLPETKVIDLYGTPTLIMHGDQLCTDDVAYQQFRTMVRNPQWQQQFLQLSLAQRVEQAKQARDASKEETRQKAEDIMDVNQAAVERVMRENKVLRLIHGHTHRPALHNFTLDGQDAERIVLGDWITQANYLSVSQTGLSLVDERFTKLEKKAI